MKKNVNKLKKFRLIRKFGNKIFMVYEYGNPNILDGGTSCIKIHKTCFCT